MPNEPTEYSALLEKIPSFDSAKRLRRIESLATDLYEVGNITSRQLAILDVKVMERLAEIEAKE